MTSKQVAPPFAVKQVSEKSDGSVSTSSFDDSPIPVVDPRTPELDDAAAAFEAQGEALAAEIEKEVVEQTAEQMQANTEEYWLTGRIGGMELGNRSSGAQVANPFKAPPPNPNNPFQRKDGKVEKVEQMEILEAPIGTPSWREVVQFVMEHGKDIQAVRYPCPPRSAEVIGLGKGWATVVDTLWRGVPVIVGPMCEIQHIKYGWAKWEDCQ